MEGLWRFVIVRINRMPCGNLQDTRGIYSKVWCRTGMWLLLLVRLPTDSRRSSRNLQIHAHHAAAACVVRCPVSAFFFYHQFWLHPMGCHVLRCHVHMLPSKKKTCHPYSVLLFSTYCLPAMLFVITGDDQPRRQLTTTNNGNSEQHH